MTTFLKILLAALIDVVAHVVVMILVPLIWRGAGSARRATGWYYPKF